VGHPRFLHTEIHLFLPHTCNEEDKNYQSVPHPMSGTDESDGFTSIEDANPDLVGVYVNDFPLPPIPKRHNDEEVLVFIRQGIFDVHIYEQARQYKPFGGPVPIQSNALWALRELNSVLYDAG
jgi:hypothetical protein